MRIELGEIRVKNYASVYEVRRKIHQLLLQLRSEDLQAIRVSIVLSQVCKQFVPDTRNLTLSISLDTNVSGGSGLNISFINDLPFTKNVDLFSFFDKVNGPYLIENKYQYQTFLFLTSSFKPTQDFIWKLEAIINEKGRDELLDEIQSKNIKLQDSLENLRRTRSAKERMESELNIGREIQMSMLPLKFPPFPNRKELDIYALLHPAREVGGDFYDFFFIDEEHFCFCIGDVSGKGVPAALFMAVTKTLIKSNAADDLSTASIVTKVNDEQAKDNMSAMFVTLFLCILNVRSGELVYTNAGHNPPYLIRKNGTLERLDTLHGPVVGAIEEMAYREGKTILNKKDSILLYTDGVTEAMDHEENLYSEDRLVSILEQKNYDTMESLAKITLADVKKFENGVDQADDITILSISYDGEMSEVYHFNYTLKNQLKEIDGFIQRFTAFCEENEVSPAIIQKFSLSADDMLNNIISYGYNDKKDHEINIKVEVHENRVTMIISDDGIPFNPFGLNPPDTTLAVEERQIGGLGIHLVQNLMDETDYQRLSGRNVISLTLLR